MTLKAAYSALALFARSLEHRLGVPIRGTRPALLGVKRLDNVVEPIDWPEVCRWLRVEAHDYDKLIREVCTSC